MPNIDDFNVHQLTKLCEFLLNGKPVFIIRAQDVAAFDSITGYMEVSRRLGGKNISRSTKKREEIKQWQIANLNRLKPAD